ncbi:MAG TPA: hypothetical protein VMI56_04665 [Reyranella sp.]|nr:hypothetical protein [Reyranella sp.]
MSIDLLFCRAPRILLVRFTDEITDANVDRMNALLARFVGEQGATNMIIDFSSAPFARILASRLAQRGRRPSRMQGFRRAFVVPETLIDVFRHYGLQQETHGDEPPLLVLSLEEALARLDSVGASFQAVVFASDLQRRS